MDYITYWERLAFLSPCITITVQRLPVLYTKMKCQPQYQAQPPIKSPPSQPGELVLAKPSANR